MIDIDGVSCVLEQRKKFHEQESVNLMMGNNGSGGAGV
jgi:hypothetical protein